MKSPLKNFNVFVKLGVKAKSAIEAERTSQSTVAKVMGGKFGHAQIERFDILASRIDNLEG